MKISICLYKYTSLE